MAVTLTFTAIHGMTENRKGIASEILNASQQIGMALGLSRWMPCLHAP